MISSSLSIFWWERNQTPKVFNINKELIHIGRDISNDLVMRSRSVSRNHGSIINIGEKVHYLDKGSSIGSKLNGKKILSEKPIELHPGDIVSLGFVDLTISSSKV
tara:strand:+ start:828 stop:1142 length:315 start_codon:yes stop_codon:yes gene_type:complete